MGGPMTSHHRSEDDVKIPRKDRCPWHDVALDGPVPYRERCVKRAGHEGEHVCPHGFQMGSNAFIPDVDHACGKFFC